jgi:hypothetical protein
VSIRYEDLLCGVDTSRDDVAQHELVQGIDFVEIVTEPAADNQRVLLVSFIPKSTLAGQIALADMLDLLDGNLNAVEITGGVRVRDVEILAVERDGNRLRIRVDQPGDFSDYRLTIQHTFAPGDDPTQPPPKLHPAYSSVVFNFKAACPSHFDCRTDRDCPPPEELTRTIDYLARDYASFRQALFDLIPTLHPDWLERSTADVGTALIELMAYSADHLSYYQDAVANEAWLETARQRISVRRHTRLIDYAMHDGASARVFVHLTASDTGAIADGTQILTRLTAPVAGHDTHATVISGYGAAAARAAQAVFEVYGGGANLHPTLNQLDIYAWGRGKCCLPRGTTRCDVEADVTALLKPGDFLLLEELDSFSLLPDETQPDHRQVVRLVSVTPAFDPLVPAKALTRLVWHDEDALTFPLCIAVIDDTGGTRQTGVARGNIVLADHGRTIETEWYPEAPGFEAKGISLRSGRAFRFFLDEGPLSFRIAAPPTASAASLRATDPHAAGAEVKTLVPAKTDGTLLFGEQDWMARPTLLSSSATNTHFVIETDNEGRAMIRFGDGVAGMLPPEGSLLRASYRAGVGTAGNVAPGALRHVVGDASLPIDEVRNPLASWGGIAPENLDEVKLTAPAAMRARSERAVTEDDYAKAAMLHPLVSKAVATFRWTGTWHTVFVAVDPKGSTDLTPELEDSVREWLTRYLQTGYDLEIDPPRYVPVELTLEVCVAPGHFRTDVEEAINAALSRGAGGFFDPDRFTFGQPLYLSQVYAAVTSIEGVSAAEVLQFHRYGDPPAGELQRGAIVVGRTEIIRLDNDPNFPDNGVFHLDMRSGK